jgi:2'-5' RNA ligase
MKRLFAALKVHPSEEFIARYYGLKKYLKQEKIRWVDPENIHITLKFFGESPEHHIPAIDIALKQAASATSVFGFDVIDTGIFGSRYKPRVIWFGIKPEEQIVQLSTTVFDKLEGVGIQRDSQNFVPHITIARITRLEDKDHFQKVIDKYREGFIQKEEVTHFHLFESHLGPGGPKYEIISSYKLISSIE